MSSDVQYVFTSDSFGARKRAPRMLNDEVQEEDAMRGQLGGDYSDATIMPLLISEVHSILTQAKMKPHNDMEKNEIFVKTMEYVERFHHYTDQNNLVQVRATLDEPRFYERENQEPLTFKLSPFELATIANLQLNAQEAISFLPSMLPLGAEEHSSQYHEFEAILRSEEHT